MWLFKKFIMNIGEMAINVIGNMESFKIILTWLCDVPIQPNIGPKLCACICVYIYIYVIWYLNTCTNRKSIDKRQYFQELTYLAQWSPKYLSLLLNMKRIKVIRLNFSCKLKVNHNPPNWIKSKGSYPLYNFFVSQKNTALH